MKNIVKSNLYRLLTECQLCWFELAFAVLSLTYTRWQSQHTLALSVCYTTSHIINEMVAHIVGWNFSLPSAIKQQFNSLHIEFIEVGIVSCGNCLPRLFLSLSLYLSACQLSCCVGVAPLQDVVQLLPTAKQCLDSSLASIYLSIHLSISILVATALCPKQLRRKFHTTNAQCS